MLLSCFCIRQGCMKIVKYVKSKCWLSKRPGCKDWTHEARTIDNSLQPYLHSLSMRLIWPICLHFFTICFLIDTHMSPQGGGSGFNFSQLVLFFSFSFLWLTYPNDKLLDYQHMSCIQSPIFTHHYGYTVANLPDDIVNVGIECVTFALFFHLKSGPSSPSKHNFLLISLLPLELPCFPLYKHTIF
mgnify:CR=1 FL=1